MESAVQILPVSMTCLPMPRRPDSPPTAQLGFTIDNPTAEDERSLLRAFRSFADAAESLESSYEKLRAEVARLTCELEAANSDLAASLEENRSMRSFLDQILESLPCGVLVVSSRGEISKSNPEACRLLGTGLASDKGPIPFTSLPQQIQDLLSSARTKSHDEEASISNQKGVTHWLAARHALLAGCASVFIVRDVSERKQLEEAQSAKRRDQALAEMSTVLAHEIRNPLGSLELFAGLLAESQLDVECSQWVEHMQAGLGTRTAASEVIQLQGDFSQTGNPLDLTIQGQGFFQVLLPDGETAYTRAGSFHLDAQGNMVTQDGNPVQPAVTIPQGATSVTVAQDGTISVTLPGQTAAQQVGSLQLALFNNPGGLNSTGGNLFLATTASGDPVIGTPGGSEGLGSIEQGMLEQSNVSVVDEFVQMIVAQRSYEANSRVVNAADQMLQDINTLGR